MPACQRRVFIKEQLTAGSRLVNGLKDLHSEQHTTLRSLAVSHIFLYYD
jgi:hypothetical protein